MAEQQWSPNLSYKQTRELINRYNKNPRGFGGDSINALRQHAHYHNIPFYEGDFSIADAITQAGVGFIQGFTTLDIGKKHPDNEWEAVARSLGHLIGFAPGILSGPLGWLGKIGKINSLQAASHMLKGARGIPLKIAEDILQPRAAKLATKALKSSYLKRTDAFDTFSKYLLHPSKGGALRDVASGAFKLGAASGISSWQGGVDEMMRSFGSGAFYGGAFTSIGNLIGKNVKGQRPYKFSVESEKAEKFARTLSGSLLMGLPASIRGATTPELIYEYLMGAYFGGKEKPWTTKRAAKELTRGIKEARENPDAQFERTLDPEMFTRWPDIPQEVRVELREMAAKHVLQRPHQAGMPGYELAERLGLKPGDKIGKKPKKPEGEKDGIEYLKEELGVKELTIKEKKEILEKKYQEELPGELDKEVVDMIKELEDAGVPGTANSLMHTYSQLVPRISDPIAESLAQRIRDRYTPQQLDLIMKHGKRLDKIRSEALRELSPEQAAKLKDKQLLSDYERSILTDIPKLYEFLMRRGKKEDAADVIEKSKGRDRARLFAQYKAGGISKKEYDKKYKEIIEFYDNIVKQRPEKQDNTFEVEHIKTKKKTVLDIDKAYEETRDEWLAKNPGKTEEDYLGVVALTYNRITYLHKDMTKKEAKEQGYSEKERLQFNEGLADNREIYHKWYDNNVVRLINHIKKLSNQGLSWKEILNDTSLGKKGERFGRHLYFIMQRIGAAKKSGTPEGALHAEKNIYDVINKAKAKDRPPIKKIKVKPSTPEGKIEKSRRDTFILTSSQKGIEAVVSQESHKAGLTEVQPLFKGQIENTKTSSTDQIILFPETMVLGNRKIADAVEVLNNRVEETGYGNKIDVSKYSENYLNSLRRDAARIDYAEKVIIIDPLNGHVTETKGLSRIQTQMAIDNPNVKEIYAFDSKIGGWHKYNFKTNKFDQTSEVPELARRTAFFGTIDPNTKEVGQIENIFKKHASKGFKDEMLAKTEKTEEMDTVENIEYDDATVAQSKMDFRLSSIFERNLDKFLEKDYPETLERFDNISKVAKKAGEIVVSGDAKGPFLVKGSTTRSREWIEAIEEQLNKNLGIDKAEDKKTLPNQLKRDLRQWLVMQNQSYPLFTGSYYEGEVDIITPESPFSKSGALKQEQGPIKAIEEAYLKAKKGTFVPVESEVKIVEGTSNTKAAARRGEGVYVMRPNKGDNIPLVNEINNFGNPWSSKGYQGTIKAKDIPTSIANYRAWLEGTAYQNVEPQRRQWILDQIDKGTLDNKNLLYFAKGYRSHANELQDFVNERRSKEVTPGKDPIVVNFTDITYKDRNGNIRDVDLSRLEQVITKDIAPKFDKYSNAVETAKTMTKLHIETLVKEMDKKGFQIWGGEGDKDKITFVKYHPKLDTVKMPSLPKGYYQFAKDMYGIDKKTNDKMTKSTIKYIEDLNDGRPIDKIAGQEGFIKNSVEDNKRNPLWMSNGWRGDAEFWKDPRNHGVNNPDFLDANGNLKAAFVKAPEGPDNILNASNLDLKQPFDGGIVTTRNTGKVARADKGVPDSGQEKSILLVKSKDGTKVLKYALHDTTPELSKMMEEYVDPVTKEKGINMLVYNTSGKQIGDFPVGNYEIGTGKLELTEGAKIFKVSPNDFRYNTGVYDGPHSIGKNDAGKTIGTSVPKQMMMAPNKDMNLGNQDIINDYVDTLSGKSFRGKDTINEQVSKYISTKDPKLINEIMRNFDDIGIPQIQNILKEPGAEPLAEKVLLEILKTNKTAIESLKGEGEMSGNESMEEVRASIDFNGTADNIIKHAAALKKPAVSLLFDKYPRPYVERAINKFIAERVLKPKLKNSMKGRIRIFDKGLQKDLPEGYDDAIAMKKHGVKSDELFFADQYMNPEMFVDLPGLPRKTDLKTIWREYQKIKGKNFNDSKNKELRDKYLEVLDSLSIRVPLDALSGAQGLRFGGFTKVKGHGILLHGRTMEAEGGADADIDSTFVFFGGRKADGTGEGMKPEWIKMFKNQKNEFVEGKELIDPKKAYKKEIVLTKDNIAEQGIDYHVFDWAHNTDNKFPYMQFTPAMRLYSGQKTAQTRNTMGPIVSTTQNMRAAWSSIRAKESQREVTESGTVNKSRKWDKKKNKYIYTDLPEDKQWQYRVSRYAKEPSKEQVWLSSALVRYTADPANELGTIDYPQMKKLLQDSYFTPAELEIFNKKTEVWEPADKKKFNWFLQLQPIWKEKMTKDYQQESRYDLIDGINRAFFGYDYNLNKNFTYEQKQEMIKNLENLSDAELSTALPKVGHMLKDVDMRVSIYDKINEQAYNKMMEKQKIIGKSLSKNTEYKKLLDRTILYRPQSKYIKFAFDMDLRNPFKREQYSENIPEFLKELEKPRAGFKTGIKNDGKQFPKITIEDTPREALAKIKVLEEVTKDYLSNSVDEIASLNTSLEVYSEAIKNNQKISDAEMAKIAERMELDKAQAAMQYKKRKASVYETDIDNVNLSRLDESAQELYKIWYPDVFKAKPTKLLDQTRHDASIAKFKEGLSSDYARDYYDLRLLGSLRSKKAVDKINQYLQSGNKTKLIRDVVYALKRDGTKSNTTKVAYDSRAVNSKNIKRFLAEKNKLFTGMQQKDSKKAKTIVENLKKTKEFEVIQNDLDIRLVGEKKIEVTGFDNLKKSDLDTKQKAIVLETFNWLKNEPAFDKTKLNETIMGIYQRINPEGMSKTLDQLTIRDFELIDNYFKFIKGGNFHQRLEDAMKKYDNAIQGASLKARHQMQFVKMVNQEMMREHMIFLPASGFFKTIGAGTGKFTTVQKPTFYGEVLQNWIGRAQSLSEGKIAELNNRYVQDLRFLDQLEKQGLQPLDIYQLAMSRWELQTPDRRNLAKDWYQENWDYLAKKNDWNKIKDSKYIVDFGDGKGRKTVTGMDILNVLQERHKANYDFFSEIQTGKLDKNGENIALKKYTYGYWLGDKTQPKLDWKAFRDDVIDAYNNNATINLDIGADGMRHMMKSFVAETMPVSEYSKTFYEKGKTITKKISRKDYLALPKKEKKGWKSDKDINYKRLEKIKIFNTGVRKGYFPHYFNTLSKVVKGKTAELEILRKKYKDKQITEESYIQEWTKLEEKYSKLQGDMDFSDVDMTDALDAMIFPQVKKLLSKRELERRDTAHLPSINQRVGHQFAREEHNPGWIIDPAVNATYISNTVNNFYRQVSNFMSRVTLKEMQDHMYDKWVHKAKNKKDKADGKELADNWLTFWHQYAREAQGLPSVVTTKMWNNPKLHYSDTPAGWFADNIVSDQVNKIGEKLGLGDKDLPAELRGTKAINMQEWSKLEAKFQLGTLLTHPKTPINNIFGGTLHTYQSVGGAALRKARDYTYLQTINPNWKTAKDVYESMDKFGIQVELLKHEYGFDKNFQPNSERGRKNKAFIDELSSKVKGDKELPNEVLVDVAKKHGVIDKIMNVAGKYMSVPERMLRKDAFVSHYIKAWERFGGAIENPEHPFLIEIGKKGVKATQFLYSAPYRPGFSRSGLGKVMSRFQVWAWNAVRFRNDVRKAAKLYGYRPNTEAMKKFERMMTADMMVLALGSLFMYSLFGQAIPAPYNWLQDTAEWVFGDEEERNRAFFGQYPGHLAPLQMITPPIARIPISIIREFAEDDYTRLADYYVYTMFPFGRQIRDWVQPDKNIIENPMRAPEKLLGLPLTGMAKLSKKLKKEPKYKSSVPGLSMY